MINKKRNTILTCLLILLLFSCNSKQNTEISVHFERYDQAVFSQPIKKLISDYPDFTPFYFEKIIQIGQSSDSSTANYLEKFKETYKENIYDSVQLVFPNMQRIETELGKALGNYKVFFPNAPLPKFYTHFSGFNEAIISSGNIISISLENYLGKSHFYDELGVYKYLREGMYPEKIPMDIIKMLLLKKVAPQHAADNLLSAMIYQGKIYYALHKIFPNKELAFLLNYTQQQAKWCQNNETNMWHFIIEHQHLFSTDYGNIRSYIDPAPFTRGFPNESPGQSGIWIGYQIVKNYMKNTQNNLSQLLQITNYKEILQKSTYNPE